MSNILDILKSYLFLGIFYIALLLIIIIYFLSLKKKKNLSYKYLIGFFEGIKTNGILALSLIIINFIYLSFLLLMKIELTYSLAFISMALIIIAFILLLNFKNICVNTLINVINIVVLYLARLVNVLKVENTNFMFIFLQIILNVAGILLYLFTTLKFIKNIHTEDKNVKKNN